MSKEVSTTGAGESQALSIVSDPRAVDRVRELVASGIGAFDFKRVRVPAGGATTWEIQTARGDESTRELDCVVLAVQGGLRTWWRTSFDESGGGSPPDCQSVDGMTGRGINSLDPNATPGVHDCGRCPWNVWGSARGKAASNAKDCRESAMLYILRPGGRLPMFVNVPPTSLKALRSWRMDLIDGGCDYTDVVARLSLARVQSERGIPYAAIQFGFARNTTPEERVALAQMAQVVEQVAHAHAARAVAVGFGDDAETGDTGTNDDSI